MQENSSTRLTSLLSWLANSVLSMFTTQHTNQSNQPESISFKENSNTLPLFQLLDHKKQHHRDVTMMMKQLPPINSDVLRNKQNSIAKQQSKYTGNMGIIMMKGHNNPVSDLIDSEEYSLPYLHEQANVLNTIIKNRDGNL
ncbi:hypothetical protein C9374_010863 [Naegleria lovaniensis]|uniref:Uncharacterized protein n=1 Tax=Naegleria lovaniensis TaxID=51637 RepID=A0AA88GG66_NAELO|nr:uncharacterized protein C9374_010863 [Naegleria lovaniensis]KAG2374293.1 hypothetical protein C9374_010863 [Naegleria lovaniensis]